MEAFLTLIGSENSKLEIFNYQKECKSCPIVSLKERVQTITEGKGPAIF